VLVLHEQLNKVLAVDRARNQMRVGAGMDVKELGIAATRAGMSIPVGSMPAYAGLTLGGVLLTSAHGSGYGTIHNLVSGPITWAWLMW
jgi:FAD/FMN-containing dehydrogenase